MPWPLRILAKFVGHCCFLLIIAGLAILGWEFAHSKDGELQDKALIPTQAKIDLTTSQSDAAANRVPNNGRDEAASAKDQAPNTGDEQRKNGNEHAFRPANNDGVIAIGDILIEQNGDRKIITLGNLRIIQDADGRTLSIENIGNTRATGRMIGIDEIKDLDEEY